VFGEEINGRVVLRRVAVRRGEVKGEEGQVDCVVFFCFFGEVDVVAVSVGVSRWSYKISVKSNVSPLTLLLFRGPLV
jgi:hypothetical protein